MFKKPKLVLCIDRDNDLYEKAGISGPIIGREANLNAAIKLGLSDPADVDTNAILKAISVYDKLSKEHKTEIATLTGSPKLGYEADEAISEQLDKILAEFPCESCIFVSDGASDETLMPIISSRLKVDSVEVIVMKQAQALEKTYFVILEKLKEPYYARLIFGVPAVVLILFVLSSIMKWGWYVPASLISIYLIFKAFGIEDSVLRFISSFQVSIDKISLIMFIPAVLLFIISIWSGYQSFLGASNDPLNPGTLKAVATSVRSTLLLLPGALLLVISGKIIDLVNEKRKVEIVRQGLYAVFTVLFWLVFTTGANWVANDTPPYTSIGDLSLTLFTSVLMGFLSVMMLQSMKKRVILSLKIENKEVLASSGHYLGKVLGVDAKNASLAVKSPLGQKFVVPIDAVQRITDKIIVSQY